MISNQFMLNKKFSNTQDVESIYRKTPKPETDSEEKNFSLFRGTPTESVRNITKDQKRFGNKISNSFELTSSGRAGCVMNKIHSLEKTVSHKELEGSQISKGSKNINIKDIFAPQEQNKANIFTEENSFTASAQFKEST